MNQPTLVPGAYHTPGITRYEPIPMTKQIKIRIDKPTQALAWVNHAQRKFGSDKFGVDTNLQATQLENRCFMDADSVIVGIRFEKPEYPGSVLGTKTMFAGWFGKANFGTTYDYATYTQDEFERLIEIELKSFMENNEVSRIGEYRVEFNDRQQWFTVGCQKVTYKQAEALWKRVQKGMVPF